MASKGRKSLPTFRRSCPLRRGSRWRVQMRRRRRRRLSRGSKSWRRPTMTRSRGRACGGRGLIPGGRAARGAGHRRLGRSPDTVMRARCSTRRRTAMRLPSVSTRRCSRPGWTRCIQCEARDQGRGERTRRRARALHSGGRVPRTWLWKGGGRDGRRGRGIWGGENGRREAVFMGRAISGQLSEI